MPLGIEPPKISDTEHIELLRSAYVRAHEGRYDALRRLDKIRASVLQAAAQLETESPVRKQLELAWIASAY